MRSEDIDVYQFDSDNRPIRKQRHIPNLASIPENHTPAPTIVGGYDTSAYHPGWEFQSGAWWPAWAADAWSKWGQGRYGG